MIANHGTANGTCRPEELLPFAIIFFKVQEKVTRNEILHLEAGHLPATRENEDCIKKELRL